MTTNKQLKIRVRERMARTGERYTAARRHVVGPVKAPPPAVVDGGYALRGGISADAAALTNALAHLGVRGPDGEPVPEALIFAASGGIGAGYILWEFAAHDARTLVLGFRSHWQSSEAWLITALERLAVPYDVHSTSGTKGAQARLTAELAAGRPVIVLPDRYLLGFWHLPAHLEAHGGDFLVAYAERDGRVHLDDRNLAPLTVARADLDAARTRVSSYKNLLVALRPEPGRLPREALAAAVADGLRDCVRRLSASSDSFSLPAWRKWGRLMTDERNAKGWPRVFADGRGLVGALASIWEGIEPAGMAGGSLRDLFADALDASADLLAEPALREQATAWRGIAGQWHRLAETALDPSVPEFAELRDLTAAVTESVTADGDAGREAGRLAAERLWALRTEYDAKSPLDGARTRALFAELGEQLTGLHRAETAAIAALAGALPAAPAG